MIGNMGNMKLQRDMIKKQIQSMDGVIDGQTKKEFQIVIQKNEVLMRDFNKVSYRRILLEKEFTRVLVILVDIALQAVVINHNTAIYLFNFIIMRCYLQLLM